MESAWFEVIVDATYTGILKPDPRAYGQCLEALDLPARSCVFVDDLKRNVDGAHQVLGCFDAGRDAQQPVGDARGSARS